MRIEQEQTKRIIENYYKTNLNKEVDFFLYQINYGTVIPCVSKKGTKTTNRPSESAIEFASEEEISRFVESKMPNTKYIKHEELAKIFKSAGYTNPKFICYNTSSSDMSYSLDVNCRLPKSYESTR